jgi:hypothetical protein
MTVDVYIVNYILNKDNSFNWDNYYIDYDTGIKVPYFLAWEMFGEVITKINSGEFEGKQRDWGSWGAKVNKKQIIEFVDEIYDEYLHQTNKPLSGISETETDKFLNLVKNLKDTETYLLVAKEF